MKARSILFLLAALPLVASCNDDDDSVVVQNNDHEYVDLGLPSGLLWATMNIGANSPEESGCYYAWGETGTKDHFCWDTYKYYNGGITQYDALDNVDAVDGLASLELRDDVAVVAWGGNWRMPTSAEQEELVSECTWTLASLNGVDGYEVSGPNGNHIFLPFTGYYDNFELVGRERYVYCWSSSLCLDDSKDAFALSCFSFSTHNLQGQPAVERCCGLPVRAVCTR